MSGATPDESAEESGAGSAAGDPPRTGFVREVPGSDSGGVAPRFRRKQRRPLSADEYIEGVLAGDRMILSRAITLIESSRPDHRELAREIVDGCLPRSGRSMRIGITGVPGVGKSTFIESIGQTILDSPAAAQPDAPGRLAVLAIDPSSARTRGSILGDKTRMETLSRDERVFIRPSAAAGSLGGVARKTREAILLVEAAGYNTIFVETVGVGQSETAVHSMCDFFLLLMLAGAGDELQGIKRGIMEMADLIAITKADGDNANAAKRARSEYARAVHLFPAPESGWTTQVRTCSALTGEGVVQLAQDFTDYYRHAQDNGYFAKRRREQARYWMYESIREELEEGFFHNASVREQLPATERRVVEGEVSPYSGARNLIELYARS